MTGVQTCALPICFPVTIPACVKYGTKKDGSVNYVDGANIAGFMKVANAMLEQGLI